MKKLTVLLVICSFLLVGSYTKAEKPVKRSCVELIYATGSTISRSHASNYKGPMKTVVKKNLNKKVGIRRGVKTKNHDHNKRFLGKLEGKTSESKSLKRQW